MVFKLAHGHTVATEPMTLVTLALNDHAEPDEIDFYRDAEFDALANLALSGGFILALASIGRSELTILCPMGMRETVGAVEKLPVVVGGLTHADICGVTPLRVHANAHVGMRH